jgi:mannose-6-phosphate isomerase
VADEAPEWRWVRRLQAVYPGDIGVLAPLYLNLVELAPGEALYSEAGTLHAYLDGFGVELMANSDNVLRGGCTVKHVDVPELLRTLVFTPQTVQILRPLPAGDGESRYATPAPEFSLSVLELGAGMYHAEAERAVELVVCVEGEATLVSGATRLTLGPGQAALAPAEVGAYTASGPARLYKATVPA